MNKNFWKRFLTWNPHHNDGFTLVELIVVIAILAILAAVAIPAYSGYIEKANRTGDEQLLNALNKAFTSACTLNGTAPSELEKAPAIVKADADSDGEWTVAGVGNVDAAIASDFLTTFAGNENIEFKVFARVIFQNGQFVEASLLAGVVSDILNNPEYADMIAAIKASSLGAAGATNLAGQYDTIGTHVGDAIEKGIMEMFTDNNGDGEPDGIPTGTFATLVLNPDYLSGLGLDESFMGEMQKDPAGAAQFLANSLVVNAAQAAAGKDAAYVTDLIDSASVATLKENLKDPTTAQAALADTALIYGVYTSYLYDTNPEGAAEELADLKSANDLSAALDIMQNDSNFTTYMAGGNGQSDVKAYLDALSLINTATADPAVKQDVLENGFTDPQMMGLLQGILGK